jgi:hypothetical protein
VSVHAHVCVCVRVRVRVRGCVDTLWAHVEELDLVYARIVEEIIQRYSTNLQGWRREGGREGCRDT